MTEWIVLIATKIGEEREVFGKVTAFKQVKAKLLVYGDYNEPDIIANIVAEDEQKIKEVLSEIQRIEGVTILKRYIVCEIQ
jgi:DNA-binding Lrp family transcriptional regulator